MIGMVTGCVWVLSESIAGAVVARGGLRYICVPGSGWGTFLSTCCIATETTDLNNKTLTVGITDPAKDSSCD